MDLRNRVAFAAGHVSGSFNFEAEGQLATYLAWLIPWGKPVTLLAESPEQLAAAQRELVRVGIDRPAAAATGNPGGWVPEGDAPASFRRATFADLAGRHPAEGVVVLDVRRDSERAGGYIEGSVHIPVHALHRRLDEVSMRRGVGALRRRHACRHRRLPAGRGRSRGRCRGRLLRRGREGRAHHVDPLTAPDAAPALPIFRTDMGNRSEKPT